VQVVDLHEVDRPDLEAPERFLDQFRRIGQLAPDRRLGGEEQTVAVAQFLHRAADHEFRIAIAVSGVHHGAAEVRHLFKDLATRGVLHRVGDTVGVGAESDHRQALAGRRDRPRDQLAGHRVGRGSTAAERSSDGARQAGGQDLAARELHTRVSLHSEPP